MPVSQDQFDQIAKSLPGMGKDPHSVRQRVEAMEQLLLNPDRLQSLAKSGRQAVQDKFSIEQMTQETVRVLQSLPSQ